MATILLVEDNPELTHLYTALLTDAGHHVESARNGQLAIEHLSDAEDNLPELVLMDIQMPIMGGLEATRALRADPRFDDLLIIALTAQGLPEEIDQGLEAGCDGYIIKPLEPQSLLDELSLLLLELG